MHWYFITWDVGMNEDLPRRRPLGSLGFTTLERPTTSASSRGAYGSGWPSLTPLFRTQ